MYGVSLERLKKMYETKKVDQTKVSATVDYINNQLMERYAPNLNCISIPIREIHLNDFELDKVLGEFDGKGYPEIKILYGNVDILAITFYLKEENGNEHKWR